MRLTRYEVARIIGLRALQLEAGAPPFVVVEPQRLRCDMVYVAAKELAERLLPVLIKRADGTLVEAKTAGLPVELFEVIDVKIHAIM